MIIFILLPFIFNINIIIMPTRAQFDLVLEDKTYPLDPLPPVCTKNYFFFLFIYK